MRRLAIVAALLVSGCVSIPQPPKSSILGAARREAAARFPGADLSRPVARDLGDRWVVDFEASPAKDAGAVVVVVNKRRREILLALDMR